MAYSTVPYVNNGDSWSASQHNTYIRDNFSSLWPFTAAGDLAVSDSTTTLKIVPFAGSDKLLNIKNNAIALNYRKQLNCCISNYFGTSIPNVSWTTLEFDYIENNDLSMFTLDAPSIITIKKTGYYLINGYAWWEAGTDYETREIRINNEYVDTIRVNSMYKTISNTFNYMKYMTSGETLYMQAYQGSGSSLSLIEYRLSATYWGS